MSAVDQRPRRATASERYEAGETGVGPSVAYRPVVVRAGHKCQSAPMRPDPYQRVAKQRTRPLLGNESAVGATARTSPRGYPPRADAVPGNERLQHRSATPAKRGSSRFADTRRSRSPHRWIQAQVRRVRPDVLHEKHQVEIVGGDRLELGHEVQVEGSGFVGLRVHSSRSMSLRSPGSSRAGRWLIASHAARASASSSNRSRSARTRRAASTAWATTNSVRSVSVTAVARSIRSRSSGVVRSSSRRLRRRVSIVRHRGLPDDGVRPMYAHGSTSQPTSTESARGRSGRCSTRSPLSAFAIDSTG